MPAHLKKLVRSRMAKTGESYATALRYVRLRAARRIARPVPLRPFRVRYAGASRHDAAIDAFVRSADGPLGETLARLVAVVRSSVPAHDEIVFHGAPSFCVGGEPFCYIVRYPRHVNLGFCDGVALSDPAKLLRGKGKSMRHVRLAPGEPLPTAALAHLLAQSARRVRSLQASDPNAVREVPDARR